MMHSVVPRRVEKPLQRSQRLDCLRVDPKLIEEVKLLMSQELCGWNHYGHG